MSNSNRMLNASVDTAVDSSVDAPAPPYAGLTPHVVLDALESVGIPCDGRLIALNSYENRVYQAWRDTDTDAAGAAGATGDRVVVKFYRPGRWSDAAIAEEHVFVAELAEREIPVVPPMSFGGETLKLFDAFRFAVYPRCAGRAPELEDPEALRWMGRFLGRIHAIGATRAFTERPVLDVRSFGDAPRQWLLDSDYLPRDLRASWDAAATMAIDGARRAWDRAGAFDTLRLHGDCHAGNVLWDAEGPHFVDFDDARTGPAIQDLWMLLSGDRAAMELQLGTVLQGYEQFREFDDRELHLVEALRTLRLLHYSGWIAQRWSDPAFPAAFPWFNTQRYWQDRILELKEQIALMDERPLRPAS